MVEKLPLRDVSNEPTFFPSALQTREPFIREGNPEPRTVTVVPGRADFDPSRRRGDDAAAASASLPIGASIAARSANATKTGTTVPRRRALLKSMFRRFG